MKLPPIKPGARIEQYPETTMFGAIEAAAKRLPDAPAIDFMGKIITYKTFVERIEMAAGAFLKYGIKKDDRVTICMPNTPQGLICLYALNRIGAVANMVHPLSSQKNITFYLDYSESKMILTLDQFYEKVRKAVDESTTDATILTARIQNELPFPKSVLYKYAKNKANLKFPTKETDLVWADFEKTGAGVALPAIEFDKNKTAVILYSGGTSGTPKGIMLSDYNFNALGC
ncbi:MAG: acyl--CoA ligase, partial [Clostridia bacterium]|nr:acyl--CoA ligase [Clostridia bacterium]